MSTRTLNYIETVLERYFKNIGLEGQAMWDAVGYEAVGGLASKVTADSRHVVLTACAAIAVRCEEQCDD